MSPINIESIKEKLKKLNKSIERIEATKKHTKQEFINEDSYLGDSACYNFIIAIETIIDIGNHILSEQFSDPAEKYGDVITKLGRHKIIDENFATENEKMADFRNKLVHDYHLVNSELV